MISFCVTEVCLFQLAMSSIIKRSISSYSLHIDLIFRRGPFVNPPGVSPSIHQTHNSCPKSPILRIGICCHPLQRVLNVKRLRGKNGSEDGSQGSETGIRPRLHHGDVCLVSKKGHRSDATPARLLPPPEVIVIPSPTLVSISRLITTHHCCPCISVCSRYTSIFFSSLSACASLICPSSRLISRSMKSRRPSTAMVASSRDCLSRTGPTSL